MKKKNHTTDQNEIKDKYNNLIEDSTDFKECTESLQKNIDTLNLTIEDLSNHNKKLVQEKEEIYKAYLNTAKEKQEIYHLMKESEEKNMKKSIEDIIFIIKQLDYVLKNIRETDFAFKEISDLQENTVKHLSDIYSVKVYKPKIGQKFDPSKERALSVEKTNDLNKHETISTVLCNAFIKGEKVISEALVSVFQADESLSN